MSHQYPFSSQPDLIQLRSVECLAEDWWTHAGKYPLLAKISPLFNLLTLAEPERWTKIEVAQSILFLIEIFDQLSSAQKELLAVDVIGRVVDDRACVLSHAGQAALRTIGDERRKFALKQVTRRDWDGTRAWFAKKKYKDWIDQSAISNACQPLPEVVLRYMPQITRGAVLGLFDYEVYSAEVHWQYKRALQYLNGDL